MPACARYGELAVDSEGVVFCPENVFAADSNRTFYVNTLQAITSHGINHSKDFSPTHGHRATALQRQDTAFLLHATVVGLSRLLVCSVCWLHRPLSPL